jgi:SAM-dependent methyltransferase
VWIPPRGLAPKTDADDPIDYYYRPLTARLYRGRLELAVALLGEARYRAVLEVGYGSGVLLPQLTRQADRVVGIDIHAAASSVADMLDRLGVFAELVQASLFELPFEAGEFDALVSVSVLEHIVELERALDEMARVLAPGGVAVLGFPVRNPFTDAFFRAVGYDPRSIHPSSHVDIVTALERHPLFGIERCTRLPRVLPTSLSAYVCCRCRRR